MARMAFLIMDVQVGNLTRVPIPPTYLPLLARTIAIARASSIKVIYVTISFRPGHPECSPSNPIFGAVAKLNAFVYGSPGTEIEPSIAPQSSDVVVAKKRVSSFAGSDLEMVLRSLGVQTLILAGMSTSGTILSTVCEAADKDFELVVLRDLCVDRDQEVHRVLMDSVFSKRARVISTEEWVAGLRS